MRPQKKERSESSFYTSEDGANVEYWTRNVGYGFTEYIITGNRDAVTGEVNRILGSYPNNPYGTWFNWPPFPDGPKSQEGKPIEHRAPVEIEPGVWRVTGSRSNTSD